MNCQDVQDQLFDHMDLSPTETRSTSVEEHLAGCVLCREEAELLGESIREVKSLPLLDTPLGFNQRVMSHVRELEVQPSFWQRYLLPLSGRIPAQATALVVVGFMGIYLLQKEHPQQQLTPAPQVTQGARIQQGGAPLTTPEPSAPENSPATRFESSVVQRPAQPAPSRQLSRSSPREEISQPAENPAALAPPLRAAGVPAAPFSSPSSEAVRATPIVSGTPVVTAPTTAISGAAAFSNQPDKDIPALRATPATIEPFADLELVVRRHATPPVFDNAGAPRPIERLLAAIPDRTRPQTIWINVPENQYEEFRKELFKLGIVESESRVPMLREQTASQGDGQIRVKLTALPVGEDTAPAGR